MRKPSAPRLRRLVAGSVAASLFCLGAVAASATAATHVRVTTVVSGLDNPRDLDFSHGGVLYVAEAGHGGTRCVSGGPEGTACFGFTSGISRVNIEHHSARRVASGIVSSASPDGSAATGVDGISVRGHHIYGIITGSPDAVPSDAFTAPFRSRAKAQLGRLISVSTEHWSKHSVGNVGHRDFEWTEHHKNLVPGQFPDANPYGVITLEHGRSYVVDAGSNTLDRVGRDGHVQVLAFFPNPPSSDAVPTCIDRHDGALYIGELTGGGNAPGASVVWRYSPRSGHLTRWATGLTAVTGCGFNHGHFYATEFSTLGLDNAAPGTGAVVRVPAHSTSPVTVVDGLNFPGGFAARGDSLYVSNWSIAPAHDPGGPTGQVLRIHLGE